MAKNDDLPGMVDWYNPLQLVDTGRKTAISTIIGENADPRLVSPAEDGTFFDYSKELIVDADGELKAEGANKDEIWIDYVSDVGDGWNSTYSVAHSLAALSLDADGKSVPRGEILIFGGDAVYPTANTNEYQKRLVDPYRFAFDASRNGSTAYDPTDLKKTPHVFALPGNHDWYDSLVAFQKLFCTHVFNEQIFAGGWRTRQERSYFALKLPQRWWLLGVDLQLSHNIDVSQLQYFESIVEEMQAGDKLILAVPEPYWVKAIKYEGMTDVFAVKEASIQKLEDFFTRRGIAVKLYVAGDLHHYRRFENEEHVQKITAGGGGAFLHPTHDFDYREADKKKPREFKLAGEYPTMPDSRRQDWKNLYFGWNNKTFGIMTVILYPLVAWLINGDLNGGFGIKLAFAATLNRMIEAPLATLVIVGLVLGLIAFTDSTEKKQKIGGGFLHALAHLAAIFALGWFGYWVSEELVARWQITSHTLANVIWFACVMIIPAVGGYFLGAAIMGLYLFISLHLRGRHDNEAFSALKIENFRNYLRLHIDRDGNLTIYPFKIHKVPKFSPVVVNDELVGCKGDSEVKAELIEKPIVV